MAVKNRRPLFRMENNLVQIMRRPPLLNTPGGPFLPAGDRLPTLPGLLSLLPVRILFWPQKEPCAHSVPPAGSRSRGDLSPLVPGKSVLRLRALCLVDFSASSLFAPQSDKIFPFQKTFSRNLITV